MDHEQSVLGVDIGGSSIKFCILTEGKVGLHDTVYYENGTNPPEILEMILRKISDWKFVGRVGIGFPGLIEGERIIDAPNLGTDWKEYDLLGHLRKEVDCRFAIINDADAAAFAMYRETSGWENENILCLTLGTGIGSSWLKKGELEAGTEYGRIVHPELHCSLERWASVRTLNEEKLTIHEWVNRLSSILQFLETRYNPDRFILSGGISTSSNDWLQSITENIQTPVLVSTYGDLTGAVGAAKLHSV